MNAVKTDDKNIKLVNLFNDVIPAFLGVQIICIT